MHGFALTDILSFFMCVKKSVSERSRSPQRKESPQRQKGKKTTAEVKKPSDLPSAKKHKPMDSDEDDEVPQNERGTFSPVPVLPLQSGSTPSSHGPSTSTTSTSSQSTSTSTSSEDESADNGDEHGEGESGPKKKEASAKKLRRYFKQFAEAKDLEWKSWIDNQVFDLVDLRKVNPKNCVTGRWVLFIKTDKQGNFLRAKAGWVLRGF